MNFSFSITGNILGNPNNSSGTAITSGTATIFTLPSMVSINSNILSNLTDDHKLATNVSLNDNGGVYLLGHNVTCTAIDPPSDVGDEFIVIIDDGSNKHVFRNAGNWEIPSNSSYNAASGNNTLSATNATLTF